MEPENQESETFWDVFDRRLTAELEQYEHVVVTAEPVTIEIVYNGGK